MSGNYPPGVTGNEWQIVGGDDTDQEARDNEAADQEAAYQIAADYREAEEAEEADQRDEDEAEYRRLTSVAIVCYRPYDRE